MTRLRSIEKCAVCFRNDQKEAGNRFFFWGGRAHDNVLSFILPIMQNFVLEFKQMRDTVYGCLRTATVGISQGREYRRTKMEFGMSVRKLFLYPSKKEGTLN